MKTIGLIGGMSWESTALYYQQINRGVAQHLGGLHSAKLLLSSLNFAEIAALQRAGNWPAMQECLVAEARKLAHAGADCLLIGTNTMHKVAPAVAAAIEIPLLHIAEVTARAIQQQGLSRVLLLGTRFTMEEDFYKERLAEFGISCLIPTVEQREEVHRIIFEELCRGELHNTSRNYLQKLIETQMLLGSQGVILGCTELPLLLKQDDVSLPLFDTTTLHAMAAVDFALA